MQEEALQKILLYVFNNSAFYRDSFQKAGITAENISKKSIDEFPVIDKETFLENYNQLITVNDVTQDEMRIFDAEEKRKDKLFKDKYHLVHSSGSTGLPAYFLYDENAWESMLVGIIRAALWDMSLFEMIKLLIEKPKILYLAATDGRYGGVMAVGDGIDGLHMKQLHLDVQCPISEWIKEVDLFKPNVIIAYPSAVKIMAELIQKNKLSVSIERVITCGEPLHPNLEKMFERVFKCPIINVYGASESLALGVGISGRDGICLFNDLNYIEIEDDRIYVTCLYNYAQPLIRYCISDELELMNSKEQLNAFTWVKTILGRNEDLLWFEDETGDEDFIHPLSIEGICVEGLRDYQFKKTGKNSFEMYIETDDGINKNNIEQTVNKKMEEILKDKQMLYVKFKVKFVKCIFPDEKTGKKKLVIT